MLLVDTSAWIGHFRKADPVIEEAIATDSLCTHEFVIGELALGSVPSRTGLLSDLANFERLATQPLDLLLSFIDEHRLISSGVGFVDVSLLCSLARISGSSLWTLDKRLRAQAERLGLAYRPRQD